MNMHAPIETTAATVDREHFLKHGYVIVRGLLDVADLDQINAEMGEMFALQLRRRGLPVEEGAAREALHVNAKTLLDNDVGAYISTARLTQMLPSANRMLLSEPIIQAVQSLGVSFPVISTRASNHIMSDALKIPGGYHKSPPHQDWRSIQGSLDSLVYWVPTTSVSAQSFPLEIVPDSHLLGLLDTCEHIMTPAVDDPRITEDLFEPLPMQPGDVVFFSTFLVHRTGEQGDGSVRIAFSGRFNNAAEETYVAHGYPTPYKYSYQTELIVANFPQAPDLKTIFPDVAV